MRFYDTNRVRAGPNLVRNLYTIQKMPNSEDLNLPEKEQAQMKNLRTTGILTSRHPSHVECSKLQAHPSISIATEVDVLLITMTKHDLYLRLSLCLSLNLF